MTGLLLAIALLVPATGVQIGTGKVSGRIMNANGMPASGVRVAAMQVPREGEAIVPTLTSQASTDANGSYTLDAVEPGTYYITAGRVDQPVYFPGVFQQSGAKAITVTAGASIIDIDFKTTEPPTYAIRGRVILQPGQAPVNPTIALTGYVNQASPGSSNAFPTALNQTAPIREDGTFEFIRLRPGTYTLRFPSLFAPPANAVVADADVTGIEISVPAVFPVTVTSGGSGTPWISLRFTRVDKQNNLSEVTGTQAFTINLAEGEYKVSPGRTLNGYEVKSLTSGSRDLLKDTLKVARSESPIQITLTLSALSGVRFAGRTSQPLRRMVLQKTGGEDIEGTVQADGAFAFDRIVPGTYTAVMTTAQGATSIQTDLVVPTEGKSDQQILISEIRRLSVRIAIEEGLTVPVVGLNFTGRSGVTSIYVDGSASSAPVGVSLPEGEYKVSATLRQHTGADAVRVKTIRYGAADLLTTPLSISGNGPSEILLTLGK